MAKKDIIMNPDSHVFLYAKGHYKCTDTMEDLRKIYARKCGLYPEHLRDIDILECVSSLYHKYCMKYAFEFLEFLRRCVFENPMKHRDKITIKDIVEAMLIGLSLTEVQDVQAGITLIPLDAPDYTILPPKDKVKKADNRRKS